jgi:methyl-accepting chemotaxis protein
MAADNMTSGLRGSYAAKFGAGVLLLFTVVALAAANTFTALAPELTAQQSTQLLSGLAAVLVVFVVWVGFITATVGREALTSVGTLTQRSRQMERGDLNVDLQTNKNDELGDLNRSFAAMRDALRSRIRQTEQQNRVLQARAEEYSRVMEAAAAGDLTVRMEPDEDIEAMNEIATSFNEMMDDLERTVVEVQAFATQVAGATDELAQQAAQSQQAAQAIVEVAEAIEGDGHSAVDVPELDAGESPEDVEVDLAAVDGAENLPRVDGEFEDTLSSLAQLNARMEQVDDVGEFISDVANETNMLALNASIEASKVESGAEGFEVVADEIKSLAEETKTSADDIERIMQGVRGGTTETIDDIVRQQATVLETIGQQAGDLARTSNDLREVLARLSVSDRTADTEVVGQLGDGDVIDIDSRPSDD